VTHVGDHAGPPSRRVDDGSGRALAITSLVLGLCGFSVLPLVGSVAAIVTGHLARRRLAATGGDGVGYARAGLWLGYTAVALVTVLVVVVALLVALRTGG
jgi:Domain of unknown function (DUF4190)